MLMWGGIYTTLGNVLSPLFDRQFSSSQISLIGAIFVLSGMVGLLVFGFFLDKFKDYVGA